MDVWGFLVFVSTVTVISAVSPAHQEHGSDGPVWNEHGHGGYRSAFMQYIVTKGCNYLAGFMHSHYVHGNGDHKDNICDWENWVTRRTAELNVPNMLSSALISCGSSVSLTALEAPQHVFARCNMTSQLMSQLMSHIVGKRHKHDNDGIFAQNGTRISVSSVIGSPSEHDPRYGTNTDTAADHHQSPLASGSFNDVSEGHTLHDHYHDNKHDSEHSDVIANPVQTEPPSPALLKWCYSFSRWFLGVAVLRACESSEARKRACMCIVETVCSWANIYINKKYHFNEIVFVQKSSYWLEDVYQIAPKFGVPVSYAHALVGCGIDVALSALNAPSWQSVMYVMI